MIQHQDKFFRKPDGTFHDKFDHALSSRIRRYNELPESSKSALIQRRELPRKPFGGLRETKQHSGYCARRLREILRAIPEGASAWISRRMQPMRNRCSIQVRVVASVHHRLHFQTNQRNKSYGYAFLHLSLLTLDLLSIFLTRSQKN